MEANRGKWCCLFGSSLKQSPTAEWGELEYLQLKINFINTPLMTVQHSCVLAEHLHAMLPSSWRSRSLHRANVSTADTGNASGLSDHCWLAGIALVWVWYLHNVLVSHHGTIAVLTKKTLTFAGTKECPTLRFFWGLIAGIEALVTKCDEWVTSYSALPARHSTIEETEQKKMLQTVQSGIVRKSNWVCCATLHFSDFTFTLFWISVV